MSDLKVKAVASDNPKNMGDLNTIYLMGYDVWNNGLSQSKYLLECQSDSKYKLGEWFALYVEGIPQASLVTYHSQFELANGCYGIGSVATSPLARNKGYGSYLTKCVTDDLLAGEAEAVFLHSDIDPAFYERIGYRRIEQSRCLYKARSSYSFDGVVPSYF